MIELQKIEILYRPAGYAGDWPLPDGLRLVELGPESAARIGALARDQGQNRSPERVAARFRHGLRYFLLEDERGEGVAWLWLAAGVPRYLDEMCWQIALQPHQAWLRDGVVIPAWRGKRLLACFLQAVTRHLERPVDLFVDIDAANTASLRGNYAAGFTRLTTLRGAILSPRLVVRQQPPAVLPPVTALRPRRRWLWLGRSEAEWHQAHIA